jgi:hypothetical protein
MKHIADVAILGGKEQELSRKRLHLLATTQKIVDEAVAVREAIPSEKE